ncbi:restriction endonuclease subunit S [Megasphaera sp.]|uniref:restriction endonuclease subunit S n=1 Tax=Megasphaera sp. TaxID=2023260 RepID=UPI00402834CA
MGRYKEYTQYHQIFNKSIPSHWKIIPMYGLAKEKKITNCTDLELLSVYLDMGVIPFSHKAEKRANVTSLDLSKYQRVDYGDFVLNNQQAWRGSVGVSHYTGIVSPAYIVLKMDNDNNSDFMNYMLRSQIMVEQYLINSRSVGSIQRNIHWIALKRTYVPVPPRAEQDQIVRFLDWKVSEINKLIGINRRQIGLLKEIIERKISDIIIHGVNNNVPTKNSGTTWIGTIPADWQAIRCKYLFHERNQRSETGEEQHLSMSQKYGLIPDSMLDERRMLSVSYKGGKICYKDDLVLNRLKAHLGVFALAPQFGVISPDYTVLQPNITRVIPAYAEMVLKSQPCRRELRIRVRGIIEGFWRLYTDDFNTIVIPVPPIEEQKKIMSYVDEYKAKTNNYIAMMEKEIEILRELRSTIISDVVTGKIDVRNIPVPAYEHVDDMGDDDGEGNDGETGIPGEED